MALFVALETGKQLSIFGAQYHNGGTAPIKPSLNVALTEGLKLAVGIVVLAAGKRRQQPDSVLTLSPAFAVPAVAYCVTNNLYLVALQHTTPPVWNALIQLRVFVTAMLYRLVYSRRLSLRQWSGLGLLITGVVVSQIAPGLAVSVSLPTVVLAAFAVGINAVVSLYTEHLLKHHTATFNQQQVALYSYGLVMTSAYHLAAGPSPRDIDWQAPPLAWAHQAAGMVLSAGSGAAVAVIVKQLDNIAKLFAVAVALASQGVASAWLYPDRFSLTPQFMVSVAMVFWANVLYHRA